MCGPKYTRQYTGPWVYNAIGCAFLVVPTVAARFLPGNSVVLPSVMRFPTYTIISIVFCLAFVVSCKDNYTICDQSKQVNYKAGFYTKNGSVDVPSTPAALTLSFPGATTFIYNQQMGVSSLSLGLSPVADSVKYVIKISNALPSDTLTLFYTTGLLNLGPECGDITVHNFTRAYTTTNTLDSVKIVAASVNNIPKENLKIYY
jgi:hypothetical protein